MTPPEASELGAFAVKDGLPQAKGAFLASSLDAPALPQSRLSEAAQRAAKEAHAAAQAARGCSLVEQHARDLAAKKTAQQLQGAAGKKAWSREDLSRRTLDKTAANEIIDNARKLGDRFSSSFQSNFL